MRVLVTGSSGLIGEALTAFLVTGRHEVIKLVRAKADLAPNEIGWDSEQGVINPSQLENFDAVVHLAGESIMGRWTTAKKKKILESRVIGTKMLCQALSQLKHPPSVLVSASAIGFYGDQGNHILSEDSPQGTGFLADVCDQWEEATEAAKEKGIRVVNLRMGMVLSRKGGAIKMMLKPFQLCLGGVLGTGKQWMSWIDIDDLIGVIFYALRQTRLEGPVNAVTPHAVTNRQFTKTLGRILHRPTIMWVPSPVVRFVFGEMGEEIFLSSANVKPERLIDTGFHFYYPTLDESLKHLLA